MVNNANATSLIIDYASPPPLFLNLDPPPHNHPLSSHTFRWDRSLSTLVTLTLWSASPCGFKTQSAHSAVIVIIIIIGSFSRKRWYPRQPREVAPAPW